MNPTGEQAIAMRVVHLFALLVALLLPAEAAAQTKRMTPRSPSSGTSRVQRPQPCGRRKGWAVI